MKYNKISPSDRKRVVDAFNNEEDWKSLCKTLGINVKTASSWFEMKVEIPEKKGGKISKKSPEIIVSSENRRKCFYNFAGIDDVGFP